MIRLAAFVIIICAATHALAQTIQQPDGAGMSTHTVDSIVRKLMDTAEVTGMCIGIINNNQPAYIQAYGYRNKPLKAMNDTATSFYGASLSKAVFAYLVLQMADEKKIVLDTPLYKYLPKPLPEYDNYTDLQGDERWKLITARMCLDHTTGFPNWRHFNPHGNNKLELFFTPGTRYAYSGEGLVLLQLVIETIAHTGLEALAQERIFMPFGMKHTSYLWQPAFEKDYANGHTFNEDTLAKHKRKRADAAGSMETTIADYTRFLAAVLQGKNLSSASMQAMLTPQIYIHSKAQFPSLRTDTTDENNSMQLAYGLGFGLFNTKYGKAFFKEGHDDGWQHFGLCLPDKNFALIVMTNSDAGESIFKALFEKLADVTIPWQWEHYIPYRKTVQLPDSILQAYTGVYEGKIKAVIILKQHHLQVASDTLQLPATSMFAESDGHFFLKTMDAEIHFIKDAGGKVVQAILDGEDDHYTLTKSN